MDGPQRREWVRRPWCVWLGMAIVLLGAVLNLSYLFNHCPLDLGEDEDLEEVADADRHDEDQDDGFDGAHPEMLEAEEQKDVAASVSVITGEMLERSAARTLSRRSRPGSRRARSQALAAATSRSKFSPRPRTNASP